MRRPESGESIDGTIRREFHEIEDLDDIRRACEADPENRHLAIRRSLLAARHGLEAESQEWLRVAVRSHGWPLAAKIKCHVWLERHSPPGYVLTACGRKLKGMKTTNAGAQEEVTCRTCNDSAHALFIRGAAIFQNKLTMIKKAGFDSRYGLRLGELI